MNQTLPNKLPNDNIQRTTSMNNIINNKVEIISSMFMRRNRIHHFVTITFRHNLSEPILDRNLDTKEDSFSFSCWCITLINHLQASCKENPTSTITSHTSRTRTNFSQTPSVCFEFDIPRGAPPGKLGLCISSTSLHTYRQESSGSQASPSKIHRFLAFHIAENVVQKPALVLLL